MAKKTQKKAVKKTARRAVKTPVRKSSSADLFEKHPNLTWLLPVLIVAVLVYFLLPK